MIIMQWLKLKDLLPTFIHDHINYPVFFTDENLKLVFYNKAFEQAFLKNNEKVIGKNLFDVTPQLKDKSLYYMRAINGEKIDLFENYKEFSIYPLINEGKVLGTVTTIEDKIDEINFNSLVEVFQGLGRKNNLDNEKIIFDKIIHVFEAKFGCVILVDNGDLKFRFFTEPLEGEFKKEDDKYVYYYVINKDKVMYFPDVRKSQIKTMTLKSLSTIGIPLRKNNSIFGILILEFRKIDPLDDKLMSYLLIWSNLLADMIFENLLWENYKELEDRFRLLSEQSLIGVCIVQDEKIVYVNPQLIEILGYPLEFNNINDLAKLVVSENRQRFLLRYKELTERKLGYIIDEFKCIRSIDRKPVYIEVCAVNTIYKGKSAVLYTFLDISYRKALEEELKQISNTDPLTGLYNRRGFITLAEHTISLTKRLKKKLVLIFIDLDNMKVINDNLGHNVGDMALKETAEILRSTFRENDILARVGGDEFVVLGIVEKDEDKDELIVRLNKKIEEKNSMENRIYRLSLSYGTIIFGPEEQKSIEELLDKADKLMYENKKKKKALTNG